MQTSTERTAGFEENRTVRLVLQQRRNRTQTERGDVNTAYVNRRENCQKVLN